jgi:hypothetical protein
MSFKDYKSEQVASALVEVFDKIYTHPLLRWRAFFRSFLFTAVVSAIYVFDVMLHVNFSSDEFSDVADFAHACALQLNEHPLVCNYLSWVVVSLGSIIPWLLFNVLMGFVSLFVIRRLLIRSGTKPVICLTLGTLSGAAIVIVANSLVSVSEGALMGELPSLEDLVPPRSLDEVVPALRACCAAMAVFVWLPLFALGILAARLLTPLSTIVGRTQWFLKEGKEHPLKAIGYVAAVVVFLGTVAARAVFSA